MPIKFFSSKRRVLGLLALSFVLLFGIWKPADAFDIAIGDTNSATYSLGVGVSSLVKIKLLPRLDIDLNPVVTEGDQASLEALDSGEVSFALVNVEAGTLSSSGDIQAVANLGKVGLQTTMLLVRSDVDEASVTHILDAIFKNLNFLATVNSEMSEVNPDTAMMGLTLPLHVGAKQFHATRWSTADTSVPDNDGQATATASIDKAPVSLQGDGSGAASPSTEGERRLVAGSTDARNYVLYFGFDSADLDETGQKLLQEAAEFAATLSSPAIVVGAYTDAVGDAEYNYLLAERRAASVVRGLEAFNVGYSQIDLSLFGERSPWAVTLDGIDEANNRRVELFIEEPVSEIRPLPIPAGFINHPDKPSVAIPPLNQDGVSADPKPAGGPVERLAPLRPLM